MTEGTCLWRCHPRQSTSPRRSCPDAQCYAAQRQTAVTAYLKSKQLPPSAFARRFQMSTQNTISSANRSTAKQILRFPLAFHTPVPKSNKNGLEKRAATFYYLFSRQFLLFAFAGLSCDSGRVHSCTIWFLNILSVK